MRASEIRHLAEALIPIALAAGRVQMDHFAAGVAVETKPDDSPVTVADRQSEEVILEGLARAAPGVPVIAEEEVAAGRIPQITGPFFLVDPLDGTKQFIKGRTEFTINIGLIEEGVPVFGLVYAPALADLYVTLSGEEAATAYLKPAASVQGLADCNLRPISTRAPNEGALSALLSQTHLNQATTDFLAGFNVTKRRTVASSLKFGLLARGDADLYPRLSPTNEWDTAAGHAVLAAAGGSVTKLDGRPLIYGKSDRDFENPAFVAWAKGPLARTR